MASLLTTEAKLTVSTRMSSDTAPTVAAPRSTDEARLSPAKRALVDIASGTVGGIGLVLVGYPFDSIKVRLQTQSHTNPMYTGPLHAAATIYKVEGLHAFFTGIKSPVYGQMAFNAAQFMSYTAAKDAINRAVGAKPGTPLTVPQYFAAGGIVGLLVSAIECPIDLFKIQLQTQIFKPPEKQKFSSFNGAVTYITRQYGFRGWFQGYLSTIYRNIPAIGCYFGFYEQTKKLFAQHLDRPVSQLSAGHLLLSGWSGGIGYWLFTYPIDAVKSVLQSEPPNPAQRKHTHFVETARYMYTKQGGIPRFFQGYSVCVLRAGPANAVCFMLYEETSKILAKRIT